MWIYLFLLYQLAKLRQSQESTLQDHACSSSPAMSAEESRFAVTTAAPFQDHNLFSLSPTTVLGSAKRTWLFRERCCKTWRRMGQRYVVSYSGLIRNYNSTGHVISEEAAAALPPVCCRTVLTCKSLTSTLTCM